ncbi:MAG: DUF4352 domain-containing protein [Ornithinimicrobium sp.]|uniref:DUF4352 domain-containing protein n=1 Tax=Ornithinimicrobium sp. TaxID=1977084 RepID=UPI0026E0AB9A|nr:DUF4352 domain-containing protein [Ornithinimicrobium sp.]MDO5740228.1 DUF4352 domain-containing protein [Ornithinimicrobium sp.]
MSTSDQQPIPPPPGFGAPTGAPYGSGPAAPEAKKSWPRRHKILTGVLGAVLFVSVIGALTGEDPAPTNATQTSEEPADASAEEGAGSSASSQGSTADETAAEPAEAEEKAAKDKAAAEKAAEKKAKKEAADQKAAEEKAAKEAAAAPPTLGDAVTIGDFSVTVIGIEGDLDYVGEQGWGEAAQGQFVTIELTVENVGTSSEMFFDGDQLLIDEQGREHSTSSAAFHLDQESLWLTDINPGNTAKGALLFDIPVDASPVTLKLSSGFFGDTAEVALRN